MRSRYPSVRSPFKHRLGIVDVVAESGDEIICVEAKASLSGNAFQHAVGQALCAVTAIAPKRGRTLGGKRVVAAISAPDDPTYEQERAMRALGVRFVRVGEPLLAARGGGE
jgi:hypothetical protein